MKHYDGTTMLYVLENDSFKEGDIKIGITTDIKKRLATLNTSVPSKFTVSYLHAFSGDRALEYEKLAHTILDDFRSEKNRRIHNGSKCFLLFPRLGDLSSLLTKSKTDRQLLHQKVRQRISVMKTNTLCLQRIGILSHIFS